MVNIRVVTNTRGIIQKYLILINGDQGGRRFCFLLKEKCILVWSFPHLVYLIHLFFTSALTLFLAGGGIRCAPYGKMSINNFESYFLDSKGNDFLIIGVTDPMKPFLANFFH